VATATVYAPLLPEAARSNEHYSTAMLEKLVHGNGHMPPNQHWIEITIPNGISYETFSEAHHPGWDSSDPIVSQPFGETWQQSGRSLLLIVPSVVARMEYNFLINDSHPEFKVLTTSLNKPIWWDDRLFPSATPPATKPTKKLVK
jgi:RES domain-containing protein